MTSNPLAAQGVNQMTDFLIANWAPILLLILVLALAYFWIQYIVFKDYAR